ncbi:site-2 protease family protein [Desulfofalx alkaliphila]|uniref:site-2 protease family protein n=1 Tax=Desulfofalx alkaliphila TaxID=105483 RepID=UPI0004E2070F|nr:site-2 protease family protein [Desulfofalx alkaliphila]
MFSFPSPYDIAILLPAIVIGLTFHEYAHAWAADKLGDPTARYMGRLTLNPVPHIDPIGLIMLFLFKFGWAKPVPVNPVRLRGNMRRSMMLVSVAGPATNIIIATVASLFFGLILLFESIHLVHIMNNIILINVILAIFNLLPVPPLDGGKILAGLLPGEQTWLIYLEQYGVIVILLLMFTGVLAKVLWLVIGPLLTVMETLKAISIGIFGIIF